MKMFYYSLLLISMFASCKKNSPHSDPVTLGNSSVADLTTDKAKYTPGQTVKFTLNTSLPSGGKIRYRKFDRTISEQTLSSATWTWTTPQDDFTGYMADVYSLENGKEKEYAAIAVDVSSDYKRFPRNGFLSKYGQMNSSDMSLVMSNLNRYHINIVQFQDWEYKHHLPLAGTVSQPASQWKDIANRDNYYNTVKGYIDAAHGFNMKTLSYNLAYGALNDAASDGVSSQWYLYKDQNQSNRDLITLNSPFKSNIYILDPSNTEWQQYIAGKTNDVYSVYNFDGYQVDQLGDRGSLFNASGGAVNMAATFQPFLQAMKNAAPNKSLVMNAVNQYGQDGISKSPVDFLYSEVWTPNEGYKDLATFIQNNDAMVSNNKKTVLAAYVNYNIAANPGYFNTPGVLMADAVIFAFGGAHLELGEHMLGKEYFPNNNLQMKADLKSGITAYYDFMVAYENLLRDGGSFNSPAISCSNNKMNINTWPPQTGQVSFIGKDMGSRQVLHLLNFSNAKSLNWRDADGTQPMPNTITDARIDFTASKTVSRIWMASPDNNYGVAQPISFTTSGSIVSFTIPSLKYWDMVVVEYQ